MFYRKRIQAVEAEVISLLNSTAYRNEREQRLHAELMTTRRELETTKATLNMLLDHLKLKVEVRPSETKLVEVK